MINRNNINNIDTYIIPGLNLFNKEFKHWIFLMMNQTEMEKLLKLC
jgi:hypothetical protein